MSKTVYLIILLNFILKPVTSSNEYCQLACEVKRNGMWDYAQNSACECPTAKESCVEVTENRHAFRKWMLDLHNEMRNKFALGNDNRWPNKVANMHALSYDYDLEYTAWCHLSHCNLVHDECRRTPRFQCVGQNMLAGPRRSVTEMENKDRIKQWYDELNNLKLDGEHRFIIDEFQGNLFQQVANNTTKIGQVTQFLWAVTTHLGCTRFYDKVERLFYYACNYGPAGNVNGDPMFLLGEPCSKCDILECNLIYRGLCGQSVIPGKSRKMRTAARSSKLQFYYFHYLFPLFVLLNI